MRATLFVVLVMLLAACERPASEAEPVWIFYSGQEFLAIDETAPNLFARKEMYLAGLNDGLNLIAGRERGYRWIADCALDRPLAELRALFENWLRSHPGRLVEPAPKLYLEALKAACSAVTVQGNSEPSVIPADAGLDPGESRDPLQAPEVGAHGSRMVAPRAPG